MAIPRFFIDAPDDAFQVGADFELPPKAAHHAGRALRLAAGERVELFNGSGLSWSGPIGFSADRTWVTVDTVAERTAEPPLKLTLIQAMVAPEKADWIVEKAVETGYSEIIFVPAERSVTRLSGDRLEKRLARFRDIARSAAEQCGRNVVPAIQAESLAKALETTEAELRLMLAPGVEATKAPASVKPGLTSVAFAVGPEGGFTAAEIAAAAEKGWRPMLLGPRVLRTETAALAAACWVGTLAGDFPRTGA
ncbi:16S rRNA (uracil(1498)-N(3))-methyltransferase [Sutterella sp.]|uniref:16S rRNA (uracil(1498)-N(3))-methyltransferase n=1 Tax=Sutterella sp. TaxID=1981025 RepID=UPI0026E07550|nr:16S rRNA (uracil(1498)-N(3))-methyltransferase [Sutterella sp.]MDO5531836.1 16S rRNA (uracil(1498)-N(3))-methyltransferase [Sutterella sp.]